MESLQKRFNKQAEKLPGNKQHEDQVPSNADLLPMCRQTVVCTGSLEWDIDPSLLFELTPTMNSPAFYTMDYKWHLIADTSTGYLDVALRSLNLHSALCKSSLSISLGEFSFQDVRAALCEETGCVVLLKRRLSLGALKSAIPKARRDFSLQIACRLDVYLEPTNDIMTFLPAVSPHYETMLSTAVLSDMHFEIGTAQIAAHQAILAVRSPVFRTMFESGMTESTDRVVKIEDCSVEIFQAMLKFLYTGQINTNLLFDNIREFVALADKYDIGHLKTLCWKLLRQERTPSNVSEMLLLAHTYPIGEMKTEMMQYICRHFNEVIVTDQYAKLVEENLALVGEINLEHAQYLRQKKSNEQTKQSRIRN